MSLENESSSQRSSLRFRDAICYFMGKYSLSDQDSYGKIIFLEGFRRRRSSVPMFSVLPSEIGRGRDRVRRVRPGPDRLTRGAAVAASARRRAHSPVGGLAPEVSSVESGLRPMYCTTGGGQIPAALASRSKPSG